MKKTALTVHEQAVSRLTKQSNSAVSTFRKVEQDLMEANAELHNVVTAIDVEMDKLASLRIKTVKRITVNETAISNLAPILGKGN